MSTPPRHLPRFLPTLTEVVQAPPTGRSTPPSTLDREELSRAIMQEIEPVLDRRIQETTEGMVQALLTGHLQKLRSDLREELKCVVRQAMDELIARLEADKQK